MWGEEGREEGASKKKSHTRKFLDNAPISHMGWARPKQRVFLWAVRDSGPLGARMAGAVHVRLTAPYFFSKLVTLARTDDSMSWASLTDARGRWVRISAYSVLRRCGSR